MERRNTCNIDTTEKEITTALSTVLSNSVSWYGLKKTANPKKKKVDNLTRNNAMPAQPQGGSHTSAQSNDNIVVGTGGTTSLPSKNPLLVTETMPFLSYEEYVANQVNNQKPESPDATDSSDDGSSSYGDEYLNQFKY